MNALRNSLHRTQGAFLRQEGEKMFDSKRYLTRGIDERIPLLVQLKLWELVEEIPDKKRDYLQVFELTLHNGTLTVKHSQEVPHYTKTHTYTAETTEKVYIIDSVEYATMLFAEEY